MKASVIIPTHNAGSDIEKLLDLVVHQTLHEIDILVIDSSSTDETRDKARRFGAQVVVISQSDFNHGATREKARKLTDSDIVVFLTQDAIPANSLLIDKLLEPIVTGKASFSYARQIPHTGADIFEAFPRQFNYPAISNIRGIEDTEKYGVYTFFNSDSCSAYLNSALDEIGGFPPTLISEDYFAAARLMQNGHKVAYVSEAIVEHSHSYRLWEEFRRYFDTGYARAENPWVQEIAGKAEERGKEYFTALVKELALCKPWLIPYAIVNTFVKLLGYRIGFWSLNAPKWWKKMLSGQRYYWDSTYYECGKKF